jgi:penicillin-binding protein 1C
MRLVATLLVLPLLALAANAFAEAQRVPSFEEVRAAYRPSDWLIADRDGEPLQRVRVDTRVRRLAWLGLDEVSPSLQATLIAAEDKRFWTHGGVDWAAFAKAALDNALGQNDARNTVRGASTVTMQLAGMLDPALRPAAGARRSFGQKWDQALAARGIERNWSKRQIFEAYLNLVAWRGETVGIAAASEVWFGKAPDGLNLAESALLSALVRQPQATPGRAAERACAIVAALPMETMAAAKRPECAEIKGLAILALARRNPSIAMRPGFASHAAHRVLVSWGNRAAPAPARPGGEPVLRTTLDARVQQAAVASLAEHLRELTEQNVEDGAIIVIDNASGDILAYVGSSGDLSESAEVDGVIAPRQAGSTLKPFLYSLAIEQRRLTAASLLADSPFALTAENGAYIPQNYDRHFKGWVSARVALGSSLNIPAVRTLLLAGIDPFYERLKALGFSTLTERADHYGLAFALGGADVRLVDLANAYRVLANGGKYQAVAPLIASDAAPRSRRQVVQDGPAFIVGDILSDRGARAPTFGLENALATRVWSAVKTGTSKDMRDNWCVGFTSRYTVGVWVGNYSGAPMWDVSGIHGAAPIWRDLVHALHETVPSREPAAPGSIALHQVRFNDVAEASRPEWFLRGTEVAVVERAAVDADADRSARIAYPGDGLIVALDPDIPVDVERIAFQMEPERGDLHWRLARTSGRACATTLDAGTSWKPAAGVWRLALTSDDDAELAAVHFSVRGGAADGENCGSDRIQSSEDATGTR